MQCIYLPKDADISAEAIFAISEVAFWLVGHACLSTYSSREAARKALAREQTEACLRAIPSPATPGTDAGVDAGTLPLLRRS